MRKAGVFVYGDIGRSPRMQNHAIELSKTHEVYFMGYVDSSPKATVLQNPRIKLIDLQINHLNMFRRLSFYVYALVRILLQILQIVYLLGWKYRDLEFVIVQNPPSIPNLVAIWLTSLIGKHQVWIDFHNYGFTILNLNIKNTIVIRLAKFYEQFFARKAHRFFCVSDMMRKDLKANWKIEAVTLYDRPIQRQNVAVNKDLFLSKYNQRKISENQILLVSSTSWTKDEDFSILLDALELYENSSGEKFIRTFITGKGPQKERYLKIIQSRKHNWKKISVDAIWLQADDYPILLSICDLGVCLHYSSSGLDEPMKVVDMFGAGIPVLAIDFPALPQLVKQDVNGFIFKTREELALKIQQLSQNDKLLLKLRQNVKQQMRHTWEEEWSGKVRPLLAGDM